MAGLDLTGRAPIGDPIAKVFLSDFSSTLGGHGFPVFKRLPRVSQNDVKRLLSSNAHPSHLGPRSPDQFRAMTIFAVSPNVPGSSASRSSVQRFACSFLRFLLAVNTPLPSD